MGEHLVANDEAIKTPMINIAVLIDFVMMEDILKKQHARVD